MQLTIDTHIKIETILPDTGKHLALYGTMSSQTFTIDALQNPVSVNDAREVVTVIEKMIAKLTGLNPKEPK